MEGRVVRCMEGRGEKKRKFTEEDLSPPPAPVTGKDVREVLAYFICRFRRAPCRGAIYQVKIGIGGGGVEEEVVLDPLVKLFDGEEDSKRTVACDILGSDLYFFSVGWYGQFTAAPVVEPCVFSTETKKTTCEPHPHGLPPPMIAPKFAPVVISANEKIYVLSNRSPCCIGIPQPSFELFDPKSGSSKILHTPPFHDSGDEFLRSYVTGFVVVLGCILISVENYGKISRFFSYNLSSGIWKPVSTVEGVPYPVFTGKAWFVEANDTVYGCNYSGIPLAYSCFRASTDGADIFLGQPFVFRDLENREQKLYKGSFPSFYSSACIAPIGKDMLCLVSTLKDYTPLRSLSPSVFFEFMTLRLSKY